VALTIGIDARAAEEVPAGRGRYVRELLEHLARLDHDHRFRLYCRLPKHGLGLDDRFTWIGIPRPDPAWHVAAALRASRDCDVYLSTNSYLTAWFTRIPTACVVYDLVAFIEGTEAQPRAERIEHATIRPALRRSAALVCISEATRADLIARFPSAASKATVVPLAADERFGVPLSEGELTRVRAEHALDGPYVLSVGTLEPRKNLERLVEAYAGLPEGLRSSYPLVLTGPKGWEIDALIERVGASPHDIRLLGYVPELDLAALYQACTVFCYPSLYEGFGLPVLEAMAAGAPVLTSNVSSLPEVAGGAALEVDPLDVNAIRAGLAELLTSASLRTDLTLRGRERAKAFSWERTARETLETLERIV
jgi:glycosyltransferase involved in cell wall biosynthesis